MFITKAVIPAAGLGSRFLPFTKSVPKEMLPLLNRPAIQYIVEEGLSSGIAHFNIVVSDEKETLRHYFQKTPKLTASLIKNNKESLIESINTLIDRVQIDYVKQPEPLGLGHAILMAKQNIGSEYFGILLPDDIIFGNTPALKQLAEVAQKHQASVIAVQEMPKEHISAYGVIAPKEQIDAHNWVVDYVVEKPKPEDAPSNLAVIGRYIFSPALFNAIESIEPALNGEIQLTDAIDYMIRNGHKVIAHKFEGTRYDLGIPLGWLQANIHLGLKNPTFNDAITRILQEQMHLCQ